MAGAFPSLRSCRAFTLIEVLTVVTIIAILAGMLFAGAMSLQQSAGRKLAFQQEHGLIQALKQYKNTYQKWPGQTQDAVDFVGTNCADLLNDLTNNPRNINFLGSLDNIVTNGSFLDPWKRHFLVGIDEDNSGMVILLCPVGAGGTIAITAGVDVAIMSAGPEPGNMKKGIFSWIP